MNVPRLLAQLLSSYLLIWAPGTFALELLATLPTVGMRGPRGWLELTVHGGAAMFCAVAGRMLRIGNPSAHVAAAIAVAVRAAVSLQSLFWTALPQDVAPGMRLPLALITSANGVFWLVLIRVLPPEGGSHKGQE
jgi:hypothetical protein